MTPEEDIPIGLRQLVNETSVKLGLGEADTGALTVAILTAFNSGMQYANEIWKNAFDRNTSNEPGNK